MSCKFVLLKQPVESLKSFQKLNLQSDLRVVSKGLLSPSPGISRHTSIHKDLQVSFQALPKPFMESDNCECALEVEPNLKAALETQEDNIKRNFEKQMADEVANLKERFNLVLQNEQVRTSCLLREAYRERQEKIAALKAQLQCKNLAGLMYVMCSERHKSRMEKMKIVEDYTNYIDSLQNLVLEGQVIMEEMAIGYKTAARVDLEWREKMTKIVEEFHKFLEHYFGSRSESSRYFFDLPQLLQICAPLEPNGSAEEEESCQGECDLEGCYCEPCEEQSVNEESKQVESGWWDKIDSAERPFVVFGDMADFPPPRRRELLRQLKANKRPPPERWQQYVVSSKVLFAECPNAGYIKDEYAKCCSRDKNSCDQSQGVQTMEGNYNGDGQRLTAGSFDMRHGVMGSLLKIVTQATSAQPIMNKASILAARDSLELASTTKLKEKRRSTVTDELGTFSEELDIPSVYSRKRKTSIAPEVESRIVDSYEVNPDDDESITCGAPFCRRGLSVKEQIDSPSEISRLGTLTHDSLELANHSPDRTDKIGYEKECPDEDCQRKHANPFLRNLPPYMNFKSPFRVYEPTFDQYEPCTTEQLVKLVEARACDKESESTLETDDDDFSVGVFVQTSEPALEQCRCACSEETEGSSLSVRAAPLHPGKKRQDYIPSSQLFDESVEFNRFSVIGEDYAPRTEGKLSQEKPQQFITARTESIMKILKNHPSMLALFQASARC